MPTLSTSEEAVIRSNNIPVIVPTRDEQGLVARSVATIWNVLWSLGKYPVYVHASCHGYAQVRTDSFREARKNVEGDRCRGLMIDDDILVMDAHALLNAIVKADQNKWNIIAPYRNKEGGVVICKTDGKMITVDEYRQLKPYDRVPMAGLGFYYGDIPLTYEFHADGKPYAGEDLNFWYDNPDLKPRIAPITLKHLKVMAI